MSNDVLLLMSGGLDSTVLLADLLQQGSRVRTVAFDDNSPTWHNKERPVIYAILNHYQVFRDYIEARFYENDSIRANDEFGYIPGYKMLMQITAMSYAAGHSINDVYLAYIVDNYDSPYRDELVENIEKTTTLYNHIYETNIRTHYPMLAWTKEDVVRRGAELGVPMHNTISCNSAVHSGILHCGRCQWCLNRKAAFLSAGVPDETEYAR